MYPPELIMLKIDEVYTSFIEIFNNYCLSAKPIVLLVIYFVDFLLIKYLDLTLNLL